MALLGAVAGLLLHWGAGTSGAKPPAKKGKFLPCLTRSNTTRATVSRRSWPAGSTIKVAFLDGEGDLKARVATIANEWTRHGNIHFQFLDSDAASEAHVRVSFQYAGYWSRVGTDATRHKDVSQPTVSLETLGSESADEIRRVTLHEFGHVLGFYHELANPAASIRWNRDAVYRYCREKQGWPPKLVDQEIFATVDRNRIAYNTGFDPSSIMCYRVLPEWTVDGFSVDYNRELSRTDRETMARVYPR